MKINRRLAVVLMLLALACSNVRAEQLHDASRDGDNTEVARLIAAGAQLDAHDDDKLTPLVVAALSGHRDTVALLLKGGANPRGRDGNGFTALHAAAHHGHLDVVGLLVASGLDINDQDNLARITPLHAAAERNYLPVVKFLLAKGAKVDLKEVHGYTPVMRATFKSYPAMVKLLHQHGATCSDVAGKAYYEYCVKAGS